MTQFSSVQSLSRVRLCDLTDWSTPGLPVITNSRSLLKLMSTEAVTPSSHLILCHPLLLLPPIPPSISVFSNESTLHIRWPKYWSFSFSISPSNEHPGLISFRMDWLDLLAVSKGLSRVFSNTTVQNTTVAMTRLRSMNWWLYRFFIVARFNKLCFKLLIVSTMAIRILLTEILHFYNC